MGGSTRIPWVRSWLKEQFDKDEFYGDGEVNPDEGVAIGAAIMAGILGATGKNVQMEDRAKSKVVMNDVVPLSYGILV